MLFNRPLWAQNKDGLKSTDSIFHKDEEPGRLFNVRKKYSTAAVSTVYGDILQQTASTNLANTFTGRLAGLNVKQGSGEPLGIDDMAAATFMNIRGLGTYGYTGNNGYNTYKIYIDGFEAHLNNLVGIPSAEIESISILKDAAALATFGMNGANGVIWVVTKRGNTGRSTVHFDIRHGLQQPIHIPKPLNAYNYALLYNQAVSNDNGNVWTPQYSEEQLEAYKNGTGTNVNWYDQILRNSAPYTDGDLQFSGGNLSARYNVILNYANQQGLYNVANTDETSNDMLKRYNILANLDFNLFKIFQARVDIEGRIEDQRAPNYSSSNLWNNMARYPANIYPVKADSDQWSGTSIYPDNPVASVKALGWVSHHYRILQGNFGLREDLSFITPGLYLDEAYSFNSYAASSYSKVATYARYYNGAATTTDKTTPIKAGPQYPDGQQDWKQATVTIGYSHRFGENELRSAINYHQSDYRGDGLYSFANHYQNINGRVNYAIKQKYIGELGFSYFGTDAYAPGHRWGFYPAISLAWIGSNEDFLKNNPVLTFLKLRTSVGRTGSTDADGDQNGRFLYQQYYQTQSLTGGAFYMGNPTPVAAPVLDPLYTANPNVFAEQSIKYNVGADLNLFKKISFTLDLYLDKRSHILTADNAIPSYFGYNIIKSNLGKVTNKGIEVNASYTDKIGKVTYTLYGMTSYNRNRIEYMAETPPAYSYNAATGRAIGTPIGLLATGYYQLNDFNADGTLKNNLPIPSFGAVQPGDLRYKDLNSDGKIDQTDVTAIGKSPFPELYYSFGANLKYRAFDFKIFFQGTEGSSVDILSNANTQIEAFVNNGNVFPIAQGAWAYYPEEGIDTRAGATYPRLTTKANTNNYRTSSFWEKSGDFLKLRNVELGISLPQKALLRAHIRQLRIFLNAENLVTWSSLLRNYHFDPEAIAGYPDLKSYNAGLSVTF